MKKLLKGILSVAVLGATIGSMVSCGGNKKTIAIVKFGTHTSLDEIESGVEETIKEGLKDQYEIKKIDCNFQSDLINQGLTSIKDDNVECIVAIATPVAVAAANMYDKTPIVFSAVSDPEGAGILAEGVTNVTGTSDAMQIGSLIDLAYTVDSSITRIGYIYTESENNSLTNLAKLKSLSSEKGFSLVEEPIAKTADLTEAFNAINDEGIDALIVTDDNNVAAGMDNLANLAATNNIPMYCAADSEIKDGGMMGYSISYTALAKKTGEQVLEIVKDGKSPNEIPVKYFDQPSDLNLYYNSDYLKVATGISIPESLLLEATDLASDN